MLKERPSKRQLIGLIGEFEQYLVKEDRLSYGTIRSYLASVNQFAAFLLKDSNEKDAAFHLREAGVDLVSGFMRDLGDQSRTNQTVAARLAGLVAFYDWLNVRDERATENPARMCVRPVRHRKQVKRIPFRRMLNVMRATRDDSKSEWQARLIICAMVFTQKSLAEVRNCTFGDVLRKGKGMESSYLVVQGEAIPIPESFVQLIDKYAATQISLNTTSKSHIFANPYGDAKGERVMRRAIADIMRRAEMPRWASSRHFAHSGVTLRDYTDFLIRTMFLDAKK